MNEEDLWLSMLLDSNIDIISNVDFPLYRTAIKVISHIPKIHNYFPPYVYSNLELNHWFCAFNLLGLITYHRIFQERKVLDKVQGFFNEQLDNNFNWKIPISRVDFAMKGYALVYLEKSLDDSHYYHPLMQMFTSLTMEVPHNDKGVYFYSKNGAVLVDTLGMICPFLMKLGKQYNLPEATNLSVKQLSEFISINTDPETSLPFHGYFNSGPRKLGSLGWGRGTGWYLLGIVDSLAEMNPDDNYYEFLRSAYKAAIKTIVDFQKQDGSWSWSILQKEDTSDMSTTALIGYCICRGIEIGILDNSLLPILTNARNVMIKKTNSKNGYIQHGLTEAAGLGKYPQKYGSYPWLQGIALGFAVLHHKLINSQ